MALIIFGLSISFLIIFQCAFSARRLKEHFPNLPEVSERTVYNTVQSIREREELPKTTETVRQMSKVPDCEYGEKCQVDYGERWMKTPQGRTVKVYFIVFVGYRRHTSQSKIVEPD